MFLDRAQTISISDYIGRFFQSIAEMVSPQIKEKRNLLEREVTLDALTGLQSRAAFDKARAGAEADKNTCFIVFDCNNFGLVNKTLGHAYGDEILYVIASDIKRAAKANLARAFRYGGDEFVVLCDWTRGEQLRDAIEKKVGTFDFDIFKVSISGCVASTFAKADDCLQRRKIQRKAA